MNDTQLALLFTDRPKPGLLAVVPLIS